MDDEFVEFCSSLDQVKDLSVINFKKLFKKKLNQYLLTKNENLRYDLQNMKLSYYNYRNKF